MSALRFIPAGIAGALFLFAGGLLPLAPASAQANTNNEQRTTNNVSFDIPAQDLGEALSEFARQSGQELIYAPEAAQDRNGNAVIGEMTRGTAMEQLLDGTGLEFLVTPDGGMMIGEPATVEAYRSRLRQRSGESAAALAGQNTVGQRRPGIEEIIVTGQKREERIQDVPIAISAFTMEDLTTSQIAGGPDLHLQVPNMTFTKTNFTGYSIQIRGIGTQAISATTDPAVAVALNQTPFIRNRFFEQEFYDLERLEVLRGPQGTLFGRNATAGVVNLISAKPKFQEESMLSLDRGNYHSQRWEAMVNIPLAEDKLAFRLAGAGTERNGYAINEITDSPIDGRDLWSTRASLRFAPNDRFDINLIWEHFEEDDDRLRSGKQLCKTHEVTELAGYPITHFQRLPESGNSVLFSGAQASFSQGCERNSLYAADSFQTPNGIMLPYYVPAAQIGLPAALNDPYVSRTQSRDLRVIESTVEPEYRAKSDIGQIQIDYDVTDTLLLESETAYSTDEIFSKQDFNRFNTASGAWSLSPNLINRGVLSEDGFFCDPQIGCADRLVVVDVSTAESSQFSQEIRLSSSFDGSFNFNLGANFLRYDTEDKYYVFINSLTLVNSFAGGLGGGPSPLPYVAGESDNLECQFQGFLPGDPATGGGVGGCVYIDPNPIGSLNDLGHNYFLSKNPFRLISYGVFGETYWNITDELKLTAGLRWSVDHKDAPLHPTWIFVPQSVGYPVSETIKQTWREPTGRLVLDWKPQLGFTDETLLYGSYSRGYKAGGTNPPPYVGRQTTASTTRPQTFDAEFVNAFEIGTKNTLLDGGLTFNMAAFYYDYTDYQISEIVDRSAFNRNFDLEVWGAELEADWWATERLRLSFKGGYQKTHIADGESAIDLMDRAGGKFLVVTDAVNPNFDDSLAPRPVSEYVAVNNLKDLDTLPADQEFFAFDDWTVTRPHPLVPSSCILPTFIFGGTDPERPVNVGGKGGGNPSGCETAYGAQASGSSPGEFLDPVTVDTYESYPTGCPSSCTLGFYNTYPGLDPADFPDNGAGVYPGFNPMWAPNGGEGISKDLGGNELPNAPNYTLTLSGDYIVPLTMDWALTWHADLYWQSESWWRVFNDHEFNRLDDYFTMNLAAIFINETDGWNIMAYVKNVTDETAITGAFLNSDDTGLTTNVFLVEPRLYGIRATKRWDGGGGPAEWIGSGTAALLGKEPGEPTPWSLTVGGNLLRPNDAPVETFAPEFISEFDPNIDPSGPQEDDLDWGDGREIVLTYAPENGWKFSLGARFGESNRERRGGDRILFEGETAEGCFGKYEHCEPGGAPLYGSYGGPIVEYSPFGRTNYGQTELTEVEEHLLVDFTVGRDVGLGGLLGSSTVSAGLRYAQFESRTNATVRGTPDWQVPACTALCIDFSTFSYYTNPITHNEYQSAIDAQREFEGIGPVLSWEASSRLLGDARGGHVDLDWSVSGGVLFGKQETSAEGYTAGQYFSQNYAEHQSEGDILGIDAEYSTTFSHERDTEAGVVPTLGAELGLSYRIGGGSISAGYRWERYFNAIDGGIEERKEYDRTIEGPYLKVTFGGGE